MPSIYDAIKEDHDEHRAMLNTIADTEGDSAERRKAWDRFYHDVKSHAAAEEESLYATMLGCPELRDEARHSVSEHKEIDDFLGELMEIDMSSSAWLAKFKDMRHRYLHHIDEEEEEMFPEAAKSLSDEAEARLAKIFENRKPKELEMAAEAKPGDERE